MSMTSIVKAYSAKEYNYKRITFECNYFDLSACITFERVYLDLRQGIHLNPPETAVR